MKTHHLQYNCDGMTIKQTVLLDQPQRPPDPNEVTMGPAELAGLRAWAKRFDIQVEPQHVASLFFLTALAYQDILAPHVQKFLQYCEDEGLETPTQETLRDIILTKFPRGL